MDKYHFHEEEQQLVASYIEHGRGPEERLPNQCFSDQVALEILNAVESIEADGGTVSSDTVFSLLQRKDDLREPLGTYSIVLNDPDTTTLPWDVVSTIESNVRDSFGIRETARIHSTATQRLDDGEKPAEVHLSYVSAWEDLSELINAGWEDPLPIIETTKGHPFPVEFLPKLIREAVKELDTKVKSPTSLSAYSALSWVSLATQHLADVSRDRSEMLTGPISNNYLIIADSGDRKTACDKELGKAVRKWIKEEIDRLEPDLKSWNSAHDSWETKKAGIREAMKQKAKKGQDTGQEEADLESLQLSEPEPPRIPSLVFENETPQSLRKKLSYTTPKAWLSCALMSSEGGSILSGHAMQGETKLDMLTTWNKQWDGEGTQTGRVGDGDADTGGSRLTVGISVQSSVARKFLADGDAAGCGAMARFWLAVPNTRKGTRFYDEPGNIPATDAFGNRLVELLTQLPERDEAGRLVLPMLHLSDDAKERWIIHHDEIEKRMAPMEDLGSPELSAVASKAMDLAARLASNFHLFEGGKADGLISKKTMERAAVIANWNLEEWKRFVGSQSLTTDQRNALDLDKFLVSRCKAIAKPWLTDRDVARRGPHKLRKDNERRIRAYEILHDLRRIRWNSKKKTIELNPKLAE